MSMNHFSRIAMTADPKLAAAYLLMANEAGVKPDQPFHMVLNEAAPNKLGHKVAAEYAKMGLNPKEQLPAQIHNLDVATLQNGEDGTLYDTSGRYTLAMTPRAIEENLDHYTSTKKHMRNAFSRTSGVSQTVRNESIDIVKTLLTAENQSFWFDALTSLDMTFGDYNRLAPREGFGFFSDSVLAANSRFAGAGQVQGTTNSAIAEQKQEIAIKSLDVTTRAIKLAPDAQGMMNPYIEGVIATGGRQMISAQAGTKSVIETETYQSIIDNTGQSVANNLFSSILAGVNSPADLNPSNIFQWIQAFGLFLKLFTQNGLNARAKDVVMPVEDYWVITSTLVAAFTAGAAANFGMAITPLQYLEDQLKVNVYPSNSLGNGVGQIKSWLISSEAMNEPGAKPTYGMVHVDQGSLYYGFSGLNFTVPQTAPVHAARYTEVAYYRRSAWATLTWT